MSSNAKYPRLLNMAFMGALLAWFALQSLNFVHAEDFDHTDPASHHCVICTHSAVDDDMDAGAPSGLRLPLTVEADAVAAQSPSLPASLCAKTVDARAPPLT